jgi:hypothetical protein
MNRIGIIIASIVAVLLGLGMCAVVAIPQMSCCAIQPTVHLDFATDQADTTQVMISMTFDGVDELRAFDANGVLITTIPAVFDTQANTYLWQTTIPRATQRVELSMTEPIPQGLEIHSYVPQWQILDATTQIGFERVLAVLLDSNHVGDQQNTMIQLSTSYDVFSQLHLYDTNEQRIESIDTAFVWDVESNTDVWEFPIDSEIARIELQPRNALKIAKDVYTTTPGWVEDYQRIGFFRGARPLLLLTSVSERMEFRFEASQSVFAQIVVMQSDGTVIATIPVAFEPGSQTQNYQWRVTLPENTYRVVFVPVPSETRRMVLLSDAPDWNVITVGDDIGFIYSPY